MSFPPAQFQHRQVAAELRDAARNRQPVPPISGRYPDFTLDDAYLIQRETRALELADGAVIAGHKIGATSEPIRKMFGIDHPDFGYVTDRMLLPNGVRLDVSHFIAPKIEGEIAFQMGADLAGSSVTATDVLENAAAIIPVLEVLDSRIDKWDIKLIDTVADNASSAMVVAGEAIPVAGLDLAKERMVFESAGQEQTAFGSAVMGHPAESVAWLVRLLAEYGGGLRGGDIVLAGAWAGAVDLVAGSTVQASFENLGTVAVSVR
jgi:2-keto-4-pentenoate hydratase